MPSHVQPRRIIINGHPTSVRLEPAYWGWLREIAAECGLTAKAFIEGVVAAKDPKCPLASALRLYIANYFRNSAPRYGLVDPASRLAFRIERPRRSRKGSKEPNRRSCIPSRHSAAGSRRETCRLITCTLLSWRTTTGLLIPSCSGGLISTAVFLGESTRSDVAAGKQHAGTPGADPRGQPETRTPARPHAGADDRHSGIDGGSPQNAERRQTGRRLPLWPQTIAPG